jgi:hypothetical protein
MDELTNEELRALAVTRNILITKRQSIAGAVGIISGAKRAIDVAQDGTELIERIVNAQGLIRASKMMGNPDGYLGNFRELRDLFAPFAKRLKELNYTLLVGRLDNGSIMLTAGPVTMRRPEGIKDPKCVRVNDIIHVAPNLPTDGVEIVDGNTMLYGRLVERTEDTQTEED